MAGRAASNVAMRLATLRADKVGLRMRLTERLCSVCLGSFSQGD